MGYYHRGRLPELQARDQRSAVQPDLGHILHSRHQYHWHSAYDVEKRPFYVTKDGHGKAVMDVFA